MNPKTFWCKRRRRRRKKKWDDNEDDKDDDMMITIPDEVVNNQGMNYNHMDIQMKTLSSWIKYMAWTCHKRIAWWWWWWWGWRWNLSTG